MQPSAGPATLDAGAGANGATPARRPIVDVVPGADVRRRERRLAWTTIAIILVLGTTTTILVLAGRLRVATGAADPLRIAGECAAWLAVVELYLYGLHRLLHTRRLFRSVHRFHHLSAATDAWTALSLHPVEALAAFGIFPALVAAHPVHVATIVLVSAFMISALIATHVNHEPVPRGWHESPATSWLTTPLVHVAHHADDLEHGRRCRASAKTRCIVNIWVAGAPRLSSAHSDRKSTRLNSSHRT